MFASALTACALIPAVLQVTFATALKDTRIILPHGHHENERSL